MRLLLRLFVWHAQIKGKDATAPAFSDLPFYNKLNIVKVGSVSPLLASVPFRMRLLLPC